MEHLHFRILISQAESTARALHQINKGFSDADSAE
jgi:hypothetical protein